MPYIHLSEKAIYYRVWEPEQAVANVVFFHGLGEHSGLYHRFAHFLNSQGYRVFAIDHIAHGHTAGTLVEASEVSNLAAHARALIKNVHENHAATPLVVIGHSLGGITASYLASSEGLPPVQGMVLTGTPFNEIPELGDLDAITMSLDPEYLDALSVDPLLPRDVVFEQFEQGMARARAVITPKIDRWPFPVLLINGEHDPIAPPTIARKWAGRMVSGRAVEIKDGHHDIINDASHQTIARLVSAFVFEVTSRDVVNLLACT